MIKKLAGLTLLLIVVIVPTITIALPALIGLLVRPLLLQSLQQIQSLNINILDVRTGWFSSEIKFQGESSIFSNDELSSAPQMAILHVNHGPIIWHLYDTMFALADIGLLPASEDSEQKLPDQRQSDRAQTHFSGSGLLRLNTRGHIQLEAITGFTDFAGDYWLHARARWPASSVWQGWQATLRKMDMTLFIDANATALQHSPSAEALAIYQQKGWIQLSNGRAHTTIQLQNELLDINGNSMPMRLFLDSPDMR